MGRYSFLSGSSVCQPDARAHHSALDLDQKLFHVAVWLLAKRKLSQASSPTFSGSFQLDGPIGVVEELLPAAVAFLTQVDVDKRIVPGLDGLSDKRQACLLGHSAAFFNVAVRAGANDIFPNGFSAHSSGDDVVQRQLIGWIALATILTPILVTSKDIATIELHVSRRQTVIE